MIRARAIHLSRTLRECSRFQVQVSIGEKMLSAYATGTAVLLSALPPPPELTLVAPGKWQHPTSRKKLNDARKQVEETIRKNKLYYQLVEVSSLCR